MTRRPCYPLWTNSPRLDDVHIQTSDSTVEVRTNHLLSVASHDTLTWGEVLWSEDCRCDDKRYVWSIHITSFKVRTTFVSDQDLVAWEVRIFVNSESVRKITDLLSTDRDSRSLSLTVDGVRRLVHYRSFKDGSNVWADNDEVSRSTKSFSMVPLIEVEISCSIFIDSSIATRWP